MSSISEDIINEFLKNLEVEKIPRETIEKLQILFSKSDLSHKDIISIIEEPITHIDND